MEADLVPLSKFESITVPGASNSTMSLKGFVEFKKLKFSTGSGFYQLSKPETIQLNKQILVQRISDPSTLITGKSVRDVLQIDKKKNKSGKFMVDDEILKEFKIFVQSTSYNRNLVGGTTFLYKKEDAELPTLPTPSTSSAAIVRPSSDPPIGASAPKIPRVAPTATGASAARSSTKVEIVISFDTTASMFPCLSTVRTMVRETLTKLTSKIPNIRIGIVAHGDYDADQYIIKAANDYKFCGADQLDQLINFVTNVKPNIGYTWPECYELVLREVGNKFDWSSDSHKSLILIGDSTPHESDDNPEHIDWRLECRSLKLKGIRVYAVQAMDRKQSDSFWNEVGKLTMGFHLRLHQFSSVSDFLIAVCFHEGDNAAGGTDETETTSRNLTEFEGEDAASGRMVNNLRQLFDQLQGRPVTTAPTVTTTSTGAELVPISPSRFQVLTVDNDQPIKQFAEARGLVFKAGRGFYEFTKPESVSDKKEVVLMDKTTGDFYTGWAAAREFSGIDPGKGSAKQKPKGSDKFVVFIQSSSYNRKLIGGSRFLYEVDTTI